MALLSSWWLATNTVFSLGSSTPPSNVSNFFPLSLPIPRSESPIISEMCLQQWPSFAWELFALCFHQRRRSLTDALLNNAIPCSHQRGGRLRCCAPQNKGGRSPVIGESWTSMPASICHDSLSLNLQSVKSLLPSWRLQEIWRAKQIWQQALSLWGGPVKIAINVLIVAGDVNCHFSSHLTLAQPFFPTPLSHFYGKPYGNV